MRKTQRSSPLESLAPRHDTELSNLGQAQEQENATATGQHAKECQNNNVILSKYFLSPPLPQSNYCGSGSCH